MGLSLLVFFAIVWLTDAKEIVQRSEEILRSDSHHGKAVLTVVDPNWKRVLELEFWERARTDRLIRILSPPGRKGEGTLRIGKNVWQYIPQWEKAIRIPPSSLGESWLGSDFTYQDLTFSDDWLKEYQQKLIQTREGEVPLYEIALEAKPEAPVQWLRIHLFIRAEDFLPQKYEYYDEKGKVVRIMEFSDMRFMGGRKIPIRWKLRKAGAERYTELLIKEIRFDLPLSKEIFSLSFLERGHL
ncbi:MAG: outer membrane lipoprotein-sorting protein [bacterium JZ-2024 1]